MDNYLNTSELVFSFLPEVEGMSYAFPIFVGYALKSKLSRYASIKITMEKIVRDRFQKG